MNIIPVSDLRNKFPDVERELNNSNTIYLTKNGYGVAVLMNLNEYISITGKTIDAKPTRRKTNKSCRGFLKNYANPDLISLEKDAARIHIRKKYGISED